jgi:hypothetical protein
LKRDLKTTSESKGSICSIGQQLYGLAKNILKMRKRIRDGTLQWLTFQRRMVPSIGLVEKLLEQGAAVRCVLSGRCRRILKHCEHLRTFVKDQSVEPTNNADEHIVRQAVL